MRRRDLSGDGEDHEDVKVAPPAWAQTRLMARSCILSTQQSTSRNRKLQDEIAKKREFLQKPNSHPSKKEMPAGMAEKLTDILGYLGQSEEERRMRIESRSLRVAATSGLAQAWLSAGAGGASGSASEQSPADARLLLIQSKDEVQQRAGVKMWVNTETGEASTEPPQTVSLAHRRLSKPIVPAEKEDKAIATGALVYDREPFLELMTLLDSRDSGDQLPAASPVSSSGPRR